jgi:hypothetical protein
MGMKPVGDFRDNELAAPGRRRFALGDSTLGLLAGRPYPALKIFVDMPSKIVDTAALYWLLRMITVTSSTG